MAERSEIFNRLTDPPKKRDTAENRAQSAADFVLGAIRGAVKSVTTDIPGFLMDAADQLAGQVKSFGEKDRSEQLFSAITGTKKDSRQGELVGSFMNPIAVTQAMIVPAFLTRNLKTVKEAQKALETGESAAEVERVTGIFKLPDQVDDGILRTILDPREAMLNYDSLYKNKVGLVRDNLTGTFRYVTPNKAWGDKDKTLGDVLDFPLLFDVVPDLRDIKLASGGSKMGFGDAAYTPSTDTISFGQFKTEGDLRAALLHEVTHGIQNRFNMNPGANPTQFFVDVNQFDKAKNAIAQLVKSPKVSGAEKDMLRNVFYSMDEMDSEATKLYKRVAGESEARAVESMLNVPSAQPIQTQSRSALSFYGDEYDLNRLIVGASEVKKVDADANLQEFMKLLIERVNQSPKK
jgi:hypothetical protein